MKNLRWISLMALSLTLLTAGCSGGLRSNSGEAERVRQVERERLRALVDADLAVARHLHADDFQLMNPAGVSFTKEEYLGSIESGQLDYRAWKAGEIAVRVHGDAAMIRYRDVRFDVDREGQSVHRGPMYHTNLYERRGAGLTVALRSDYARGLGPDHLPLRRTAVQLHLEPTRPTSMPLDRRAAAQVSVSCLMYR